jgi:hypothetical protein
MNTPTAHPKPVLDDKAIASLKQINAQLDALQMQIHEVAKTYHRHISQAAQESGLPLDNIYIEAELDFCLKPINPHDDCAREQDDDGVVSRTLSNPQLPDLLNFGIDEPGSVIGPQGWLFHDLTKHAYGIEQPQVTHAELLALDSIYVELVIRHPVQFER